MPPITASSSPRSNKILVVATSHGTLGNTGKATGVWLSEIAHPYEIFVKNGFDVEIASPQGGEVPIEPESDPETGSSMATGDEITKNFKQTNISLLRSTIPLGNITNPAEQYCGVFVAGGTGAVFDLPQDPNTIRVLEAFVSAKKPIATVCHGTAALMNVNDRSRRGHLFVAGRTVTGFSNQEERKAHPGLETTLPCYLEDALRERGAVFLCGPPFKPFTVRNTDFDLVCGQNNFSAGGTAELLVAALRRRIFLANVTLNKSASALQAALRGNVWESCELERLPREESRVMFRRRLFKMDPDGKCFEMLVDVFADEQATMRVFSIHFEGTYHVAEGNPNPDGSFNFEWAPHRVCMIPQSQVFIDEVLKKDARGAKFQWEVGVPVDVSTEGVTGAPSIVQGPMEYDICALGTWNGPTGGGTSPAATPSTTTTSTTLEETSTGFGGGGTTSVSQAALARPLASNEAIVIFGERGWPATRPEERRVRLDSTGFKRADEECWKRAQSAAIRTSASSLVKRIAILGGGEAGSALYEAFSEFGFPTTLGEHHLEKHPEAVPTEDAAVRAEVIILAVPTDSLSEVLERVDFSNKIVIDVTNPAGPQLFHTPPTGYRSNGEFVERHARGARAVFKCFNAMGCPNFTNPVAYPSGIRKDLYICGTDGPDKNWLLTVCRQAFGFNATNVGGIDVAHLVEQNGNFWMLLAKGPANKGVNFGFTTVE